MTEFAKAIEEAKGQLCRLRVGRGLRGKFFGVCGVLRFPRFWA